MKKIILTLIVAVFLISFVSANLGSFDKQKCVNLLANPNSTNVNLTSVTYPDGSRQVIDSPMQQIGNEFNYTFCNTIQTGNYIYSYYDGSNKQGYTNTFLIKNQGTGLLKYDFTSPIMIIIFVAFVLLCIFFFVMGMYTYSSGMLIAISFLILFNTGNILIPFILIALGVAMLFIPDK